MLRNEKFCGDMVIGKKYFHNGKRMINDGELTEKMFVQNNHEGIISKETFALAQQIRTERRKLHLGFTNKVYSPYVNFVFSSTNECHLRYTVERPKGRSGRVKSEIPTLYCNGLKPGTKRVGFQVKVIMDLLNQIINEIKTKIISLTLQTLKDLTNIISTMELSSYNLIDNDLNPLTQKMKYIEILENLKQIRKVVFEEKNYDIHSYRKVFRKIIVNENSISIKISLSDDNSASIDNYDLIHKTEFTYIKLFKPITLQVYIYFESSFM